jgi:hypothetical protein
MRYRFVEIVDFEIEVDHHLLFGGTAGPGRRNEQGLGGESQSHAAIGGGQRHPVGLDFPVAAAKEALIEVGESVGVSRIKHDLRQRDTRRGRLMPSILNGERIAWNRPPIMAARSGDGAHPAATWSSSRSLPFVVAP